MKFPYVLQLILCPELFHTGAGGLGPADKVPDSPLFRSLNSLVPEKWALDA